MTGICFSQGSGLSLAAEMLEMFALAAARRKPNAEESRESCGRGCGCWVGAAAHETPPAQGSPGTPVLLQPCDSYLRHVLSFLCRAHPSGEVGELRGGSSPAPRGDTKEFMTPI